MTTSIDRLHDGRTYSVFIAAADDCEKLRDAAVSVFDSQNKILNRKNLPHFPSQKFSVFDWRTNKKAGHAQGKFQDQIFDDAALLWGKPECDILVLILWCKFGTDTKREYEKYAPGCQALLVCHYNEPVGPLDLIEMKIDSLFEWIQPHRANWAEISTVRGSIRDITAFQSALGEAVGNFIFSSEGS